MEYLLMVTGLTILGLMMGSFAGATVWRLRARQLVEDKAAGEKVDKKEYEALLPLTKSSFSKDRSRCLHCSHVLAWYDLIPLISWLSTGGKCRYCKQPIGWFEPVIEIGTAVLFVLSYLFWPELLMDISSLLQFALWLVAAVLLVILFAYDARWFLLPNVIMFPLIGIGAVFAVLHILTSYDPAGAALSLSMGIAILSGLYLLLWFLSRGAWIGFGDVKLGLALALLLGEWQLAFLALFAANVIGSLLVIPGMLSGRITRGTRVPFGPLLIVGAIAAMLGGHFILDWYFAAFA